MKAYKIELFVIDMDGDGEEAIKSVLERGRLKAEVKSIEGRDIGVWTDEHPFNKIDTCDAEYARLFK